MTTVTANGRAGTRCRFCNSTEHRTATATLKTESGRQQMNYCPREHQAAILLSPKAVSADPTSSQNGLSARSSGSVLRRGKARR